MSDTEKLSQVSVEDLRAELRAREARARTTTTGGPAGAGAATAPEAPNPALAEFDDKTILRRLKSGQKVIYVTDDRVDIFQLAQGFDRMDAESVVALFRAGNLTDNGNGTSTLTTQNFGTARNLCAAERFRTQPIGAFCSGVLVGSDVIATAGHCVNAGNVATVRFVFGFRMQDANTAATVISNEEIYAGAELLGREEIGTGADWALVRVDRPVLNHPVARLRRAGRIADNQAIHVIGHPVGLPTKFAGGAAVRDNRPAAFFVANLDTYGGNSGSPVFNSGTHEVEGILVRGETDFTSNGTCNVSLVCPTTGCRGEDSTRVTEFANRVIVTPADAWVESWGPDRLDIFGLGTDRQMFHKAWDNGWHPSPTGWEPLGGAFASPPAVVAWGPNRLDIFGLGMDRQMYHKAWDGTRWHPSPLGWEPLGGIFATPPAVASWGPDRLDIFGLGTDRQMYHKAWDGTAWHPSPTGWEPLGGVFTSPPAVASWASGRLDIFGLGTDHQMFHKAWDNGWHPSPTGWEPLGGIFTSAADVVAWGPNRLDIFGLGTDRQMFHKAWDGTAWHPSPTGWEPLGGVFSEP
jgi:V8-like Glu-specific endopeptidase